MKDQTKRCCAQRVYRGGREMGGSLCANRGGHGPGGAYCAHHAKGHEPRPAATIELWGIGGKSRYHDLDERPKPTMATEVTAATFINEGGRRVHLRGYTDYYTTELEALRVLQGRANRKLVSAKETIEEAERALQDLDSEIAKLERR